MSDKQKPRLHCVIGTTDRGLFSSNLEWFYNVMDGLCGNTSFMSAQVAVLMGVAGSSTGRESNNYTDHQVGFGSTEGHFTRGRRVWRALVKIPYDQQRLLAEFYEPRSYLDHDHSREHLGEQAIRLAHEAYYKAERDHEEE